MAMTALKLPELAEAIGGSPNSGPMGDNASPRDKTEDDIAAEDDKIEIQRMPSGELLQKAKEFDDQVKRSAESKSTMASGRTLLVNNVLDDGESGEDAHHDKKGAGHHKKKGAFAGVFVPTCENMWGVLIFLRFYFIVGHAGVGQALCAVVLSFACAFCTTTSMSATVSSGGFVSHGGPYYMISRSLGPSVGAAVGIMYWLAITMLAVLEVLGAVEGILMAAPGAEFPMCKQAYGSGLLLTLVLFVAGGISLVSRLGIVFVFVVFFSLFIYYFGLVTAPVNSDISPMVTGLSFDTLKDNWYSHYGEGINFGYVLSVFFPCFTGILSGANRADILQDPPKNLREGTYAAIIFSLFMYASFMIMWGSVANYQYLQGNAYADGSGSSSDGRRLAGGAEGAYVVDEIVWNPFPHCAHIGIIISSLSQALQCLVVSPRLLQSIAKDDILAFLGPCAPLTNGEPKRALFASYIVAALLVLLGQLDLVAPLLSMCFLVAYAFMNLSCCTLTYLRSPAWRPKGIHKKRFRMWYIGASGLGFLICLAIMFTISPGWAIVAIGLACTIYFYINWKMEAKGWGSAMDGIRFQLALNSLIQLETSQSHQVNWRPQVLILYRIHLAEELKGIKHHEILRFYSQLRKGNGFCVVACVLEADMRDEHAIHKARIEKKIITSIMKEEGIAGFAEVVVAPSWGEGTNYIIQLTGIGGLVPNTVLLDWPTNWKNHIEKAIDFVSVLQTALAEDKAVLAVRGLVDMPAEVVYGTIDVWWMIHDGGFLILLSWLLVQHRTWRKCHMRIFTITEGVSEEQAQAAAELLTKTLKQRRLFDVDVEVILADDEMIEPYTYDWTLRVDERHKYLEQIGKDGHLDPKSMEAIPLEIDDLFKMEEAERGSKVEKVKSRPRSGSRDMDGEEGQEDRPTGKVVVSDIRKSKQNDRGSKRSSYVHATGSAASSSGPPRAPSFDAVPKERNGPQDDVVSQVRAIALGEDSPPRQVTGQSNIVSPSKDWQGGAKQPTDDLTILAASPDYVACTSAASTMGPAPTPPPSGNAAGLTLPPETLGSPSAGTEQVPKRPSKGGNDASPHGTPNTKPILGAMLAAPTGIDFNLEGDADPDATGGGGSTKSKHASNAESFHRLNQIIYARSKRAQLVVMNLPDLWGTEPEEVKKFMGYCDTLTKGLERVLFVHSSGHEIFDISM